MKKMIDGIEYAMTAEEIAETEKRWAKPLPLEMYQLELHGFINAKARERGYDSALSIISYYNSSNAQWATEAQAFMNWRDAVFTHALALLNAVENKEQSIPSISDFLETLPNLEWPKDNV